MIEYEYFLKLVEQNTAYIAKLNDESKHLQADVAVLKEQVKELIWYNRLIIVGVVGVVIERLAKAVSRIRNNNKK